MKLTEQLGKPAIRLVASGVAALSVALGTGAIPAAASATGPVGAHAPAAVDCNVLLDNGMLVHFPEMWAVPVQYPGNVFIIGPSHVQWVAYQATLLRWDGKSQWLRAAAPARWKARQVPDNTQGSFFAFTDYEFDGSKWQQVPSGATRFDNLPSGYYKVSVEYHWYEDALVTTPGSDVIVPANYTYSGNLGPDEEPYCAY